MQNQFLWTGSRRTRQLHVCFYSTAYVDTYVGLRYFFFSIIHCWFIVYTFLVIYCYFVCNIECREYPFSFIVEWPSLSIVFILHCFHRTITPSPSVVFSVTVCTPNLAYVTAVLLQWALLLPEISKTKQTVIIKNCLVFSILYSMYVRPSPLTCAGCICMYFTFDLYRLHKYVLHLWPCCSYLICFSVNILHILSRSSLNSFSTYWLFSLNVVGMH